MNEDTGNLWEDCAWILTAWGIAWLFIWGASL